MTMIRKSVLFICLGNICRSPTAEAVFKKRSTDAGLSIWCDSAGTGGYHIGEPPDSRSAKVGRARGYSFAGQSSRKIETADFEAFDLVLAMDKQNLLALQDICPAHFQHKLKLFLDYAPHTNADEVPDPYYGAAGGFDHVIDLVEMASEGLIRALKQEV